MLGKEFENYFIRCKKCGRGCPKDDFKGSINRVCIECREGVKIPVPSHK